MAQTAEKLELYEVPGGGIGEFVKSDKEIEALEKGDKLTSNIIAHGGARHRAKKK